MPMSTQDCAYAVNSLAQYFSNLGLTHIQTLKRTMKYIKSTLNYGIKYQQTSKEISSMVSEMLIGLEIKIIVGQLQIIVLFWQKKSSLGVVKGNKVLLYPLLNLNTWP
jgi:hypothetical protein